MADKQSSEDDDYVNMSDNPNHLRVIFDKTTPNVRNLNRKDSTEDQLLPLPVDRSRDVTLYFSDQYGGSVGFHPKVVSLVDKDVIDDISKWMSNFMHEIIGMDRLLLVQNRSQFDEAKGNIGKLKDVLRELEEIPPTLVNLLPETNNEAIRDLVLEDLLSLSQVCIDISGRLKRMSSQYELALKRLAEKRHTRMNDAILQGMEGIPAELLVQTVHPIQPPDSATMNLTQITDEQDSFNSTLSIPVTSSDTNTIEQARLSELSLTTITEERTLSEEERRQLLQHVRDIVGHNHIDHKELTDPEAALKLLTEKVGTVCDLHDPDLLHKLQSLCRSKRFLQKIVSNPNARPPLQINTTTIECDPPVKQALSTPTSSPVGRSHKPSGNSEPSTIYTITEPITSNESITITGPIEPTAPPASSEPMSPASTISNPPSKCNESSPTRPTNVITTVCTSMYDTPVFSTPVLTTPKEFYTIFHTANSSTPHYAPLRTANDDTPILPTSSASSKRNLTQEINQTDPSTTPPHLGPNLTSTTSQDDLDRHQRDSICPSVRPKATLQKGPDDPHPHTSIQTQVPLTATGSPLPGTKSNNQNKSSQLLNKETDHIPTPYNLDELFMISNEAEMKQCIGDHIYPYVLKKLPPGIARKITGMIINLPKEQLATGIHSQQTLDRMIKEARETLSETYGDTYEQSIPDNDTYSAMFHEVMSSPAKKQRTQGENAPARSLCMSISSTHSKEDEESQGGKINDSSRFEICFEKGFYNPNRHDNNDEEFAPLKLGVAGGLDTKKSCVEKSSDVLLQESIRDLLQCCSTLTIMDDVGEAKEENVEYVPTEQELREDLEGLVFGGYLPKVMRELTPPRTGNSNESSLSQLVNIEDIAFVPKQPRAQVNENYLRKKTFGLEKYFGETCTSNMPSENFEKTHISSKPSEKSKKKRPRKRYRNRGYYDSSEDEDRNAISSKPSEKFTKFDQMFKRRGEKKVTGVASDKEEVKTKGACSPNSKQYSDDNRIVQTSGLSESSLTDVKGKNVDVNVSEDNVDELLDDSVRIIDGNNNEQEGDKKLTQGDL